MSDSSGAKIKIRTAGLEDIDAIVDVWWQMVSEHEQRDPAYWRLLPKDECREKYRAWKEKFFQTDEHFHIVAEISGRVCGFVHCQVMERPPMYELNPVGRVDEVAVHKDFRKKGAGRKMLEAALNELKKRGLTHVELMVDEDNPAAQKLYVSNDFYTRQRQMVKKL